jgi:ribosomal protein S18 acetylase RimI-like enzyme
MPILVAAKLSCGVRALTVPHIRRARDAARICQEGASAISDELHYQRFAGSLDDAAAIMLPLCRGMFAGFTDDYLRSRLPLVVDPRLWLAMRDGTTVGFKFGYRREPDLFYSWLGGVDASARKLGIASELMKRQHADLADAGYRFVATRTRAANNAMLILNLKQGFQIAGYEIDQDQKAVVWQRKALVLVG